MERSPLNLNDCPNEIILQVFSNFDQATLMRSISRVCRRWNVLAKSQSLWTRVDFSGIPLKLRDLKKCLSHNLIGSHTLHLSIRFKDTTVGIETTLKAILEKCSSLQELRLQHGRMQLATVFFCQLPLTIRMPEIDSVEAGAKHPSRCELSVPQLHNIETLAVTHCAWFCDSYLTTLLKRSCSPPFHSHLRVLDVSGCNHLFQGYPSIASLQTRIAYLSSQLGAYCPHLYHLDISSVFTVSLRQEELQLLPSRILSKLTDKLTQLLYLNLSYNHSIVHLLINHQSQEVMRAFQTTLSKLNFIVRPDDSRCVTLQLNGWPTELIEVLVQAVNPLINDCMGRLTLMVDDGSVYSTALRSCGRDRVSVVNAASVPVRKHLSQYKLVQSNFVNKRMRTV